MCSVCEDCDHGIVQAVNTSEKSVIVALDREGLSSREIARKVGCNRSSVSRILTRNLQTGDVARKRGTGLKRVSTPAQDRILKRLCLSDRRAGSNDLKLAWKEHGGVSASARTVRKRLFDLGLKAYRPRKKPLLTTSMKKKRLAWAKEHSNWTIQQWERVIFSDESKFNLHGSDGKQYVRRRSSETYHPDCIDTKVKFPVSEMVWGCITSKGVGKLKFISGTVNAERYIAILEECLKPSIKDSFRRTRNFIFQQDSAPCHTAKKVNIYLV